MYTLDRFARNRYDSAIYKAKLKRNGVKIFYAKQPMPDTPEGIILESVLEGYAEYYSENLARSIKRGMKENALHGIAMGSPVLGYKIGNDRQYEIDPVGAKAVRTIFTMYAEGKSKTQIVNWLNEHGFKTSRGNAFNKNSLSRILRNDKYIGVYRYDDVVLEDAVPPIIDKTLFDKVQATFRHNYTARAKAKAIEDYLLTTKVFCGHCGEPMVGESGTSKTGKVHHYYKCVNRKRKHNCEKKVEKKEWLERTVVEFTVQQVLTDENIEKISTRAMELIEKELQDTSVLIGLQERLKETNKRIKNLMSAIEQGIITPTTKERLEELEEERRDLEGHIAREEIKKPLLTKERIMYWLESFKRGDIEDVEYQRRIIDTLVNSVYVYDDGDKGRKLVLTFNISGNNTLTISSSDIERTAPLKNPVSTGSPVFTGFFTIKTNIFHYIKFAKTDAPTTVQRPHTTIARLLIAPSTSPISIALAVPTAWAAVPMASPLDTAWRIRKNLHTDSAAIFPSTPVMIMVATEMVTYPPSSSDTPIPIAVVMDFGRSVTYSLWLSPKAMAMAKILPRLANTPDRIPVIMATTFFLRTSSCIYSGIARQTVAGVKR